VEKTFLVQVDCQDAVFFSLLLGAERAGRLQDSVFQFGRRQQLEIKFGDGIRHDEFLTSWGELCGTADTL